MAVVERQYSAHPTILSPQLWLGRSPLDPAKINPVTNTPQNKPFGGFWTSTYHETLMSDWVLFSYTHETYWKGTALEAWIVMATPDARVYRIDGYYDFEELLCRYHVNPGWNGPFIPAKRFSEIYSLFCGELPMGKAKLDFEAISRDYDAVHLTERGLSETKYGYPYNLMGWDVESTLWFRWSFSRVEYLGNLCTNPLRIVAPDR
ncbi:hypothetical protein H1S01_03525 [Heliobacterium chlorum]|uniref:Uncharacterized protein n=1 Tax=Heliobacterium chlorum TaxID=2698 RepID=A0ABR7SYH5_HELCL|nr:hypothetical protein [Heliobacterium chlorum]MBC9783583.1 hypothetical protein [Heliobacterium chlorum]